MIGFLVGTACLIGLITTLRSGRGCRGCALGYGGGCSPYGGGWSSYDGGYRGWGGRRDGPRGGGWGGRGDFPGGWVGTRTALRFLFEHLDATPGQKKAIVAAIDEIREAGKQARKAAKKARADIAKAVRASVLDTSAMASARAEIDGALDRVRDTVQASIATIHEVLDDDQKKRLADLIEEAPGSFPRWAGPYRGGGFGGEEI